MPLGKIHRRRSHEPNPNVFVVKIPANHMFQLYCIRTFALLTSCLWGRQRECTLLIEVDQLYAVLLNVSIDPTLTFSYFYTKVLLNERKFMQHLWWLQFLNILRNPTKIKGFDFCYLYSDVDYSISDKYWIRNLGWT